MFKETFTAMAIVAGLVATSAQVREGGEARMQERFGQIDVNSDGQITVEELQAQATARFTAADADGNGALTAEEIRASMKERHKEHMLNRLDTNGDGTLSDEELSKADGKYKGKEGKMEKRAAKHFERMDADKSGDISLEEMQSRRDPAKMVTKLDTDKSGGLSIEEFAEARGHGKHKMKRDAD